MFMCFYINVFQYFQLLFFQNNFGSPSLCFTSLCVWIISFPSFFMLSHWFIKKMHYQNVWPFYSTSLFLVRRVLLQRNFCLLLPVIPTFTNLRKRRQTPVTWPAQLLFPSQHAFMYLSFVCLRNNLFLFSHFHLCHLQPSTPCSCRWGRARL